MLLVLLKYLHMVGNNSIIARVKLHVAMYISMYVRISNCNNYACIVSQTCKHMINALLHGSCA